MEEEVEAKKEETLNTCETCMGDNLLKDVGIKKCLRCEQPFCVHFASLVDPNYYCVDCMSDLELLKNEQVHTRDVDWDTQRDRAVRVIRHAMIKKIGGLDYLFAQRRNVAMTDAELELAIEYHKQQVTSMILEREERKVKALHAKSLGIKLGNVSTTTITKSATGTTTKTRIDKTAAQLAALLQSQMQGKSAAEKAQILLNILGK